MRTSSWSPVLMKMPPGTGTTSTQSPPLRNWRPGTSSWRTRMMPPASVWVRRPVIRSGLGQDGYLANLVPMNGPLAPEKAFLM